MPITESESYSSPRSSAPLLAKNLEEMDQSVKEMLKLIEEDKDSFTNNSDVYEKKRPELISHIENFCSMYQSLANRCDQLTGGVSDDVPSDQFQVLGSGIADQGSPQRTPGDRLSLRKSAHQDVGIDTSPSSGGGSSDQSLKGGSESFSSSSSDSDSDSYNCSINNYMDSPMTADGKERKVLKLGDELPSLESKLEALEEDNSDSRLVEAKHGSYDELLGIVGQYEEELKVSKLKLQHSEEEIDRLKSELEKKESIILLEADLRAQLEETQRTIKVRDADLDMAKRHGLQMQEQIALLETQLLESNLKMGKLMEEFEVEREKLKDLDEENAQLKKKLEDKISEDRENIATLEGRLDMERMRVLELQESIVKYQAEVSDLDNEVRELEATLCDAHENFSKEKAQLQSEIGNLLKERVLLEAKLNEWELRSKSLEDRLRQSEVEKSEMRSSTDALELGLRREINDLKEDLDERGQHLEHLNKTLDGLKLKYDMLMSEKDQANAKIQTLIAEASAQDDQIRQMEEHIGQLRMVNETVVAGSESVKRLADELALKVEELEEVVNQQKIAIANGAEEKREAIRQLCFSLEHYRSGYQELRQAFIGQRHHAAVMAS